MRATRVYRSLAIFLEPRTLAEFPVSPPPLSLLALWHLAIKGSNAHGGHPPLLTVVVGWFTRAGHSPHDQKYHFS